jgi:predicted GH43/DUF377 family glycosyl hydrolase
MNIKQILAFILLLCFTPFMHAKNANIQIKGKVKGNYELNVTIEGDMTETSKAQIYFSGNDDLSTCGFLEISGNGFTLMRRLHGTSPEVIKKANVTIGLPMNIKILKQRSYFLFWVNNATEWMQGPMGFDKEFEPWVSSIGVNVQKGLSVKSASLTELPMLSQFNNVVLAHDKKGTSWKDCQVVPGTILKWTDGQYYMYFMGATYGNRESGATHRSIGVASSSDLIHWTITPEKLIQPFGELAEYFPGGAIIQPDGRIALMFTAQNKDQKWQGFYLATATTSDGKFRIENNGNPVYKFENTAHEFDLVQVDNPNYKYMMFFAGFIPSVGDRGFMVYSNDLKTWTEDKTWSNFKPQTTDNWDAIYVRPRSLNKLGDIWYLWYEGVNNYNHYSYDVVGLARSKDLYNWEYHPHNPILCGMGESAEQVDNTWTGWPRMVIKDNKAYVFYAGSNPSRNPVDICMRTMSIEELTDWNKTGKTRNLK